MAFEITGKVIEVSPVTQVSDKFRKREFVIEKKETGGSAMFIDYIKFQVTQDKCDLINESYLNENVTSGNATVKSVILPTLMPGKLKEHLRIRETRIYQQIFSLKICHPSLMN